MESKSARARSAVRRRGPLPLPLRPRPFRLHQDLGGGIVLPMITKGLQSINLVENSSGMCGVMLLLLGCGP
jgi:hypothetical protein